MYVYSTCEVTIQGKPCRAKEGRKVRGRSTALQLRSQLKIWRRVGGFCCPIILRDFGQ